MRIICHSCETEFKARELYRVCPECHTNNESRESWQIIEEAPDYAEAVGCLMSWATNYEFPQTPYVVFLDLIGYAAEEFGERLLKEAPTCLGYLELGMLAEALTEYADRPGDIVEFINAVERTENN